MVKPHQKKQLIEIWEAYARSDKRVYDAQGNELPDIDQSRLEAKEKLLEFIKAFKSGEVDVHEFKTTIDSFNKRNNLWGFTATKGQMFFNQLVRNSKSKGDIENLEVLLRQVIAEPGNLDEATSKIQRLEKYCEAVFKKATDKRKVPNPGSVGYFLSYFWQLYDHKKWPIMYTSLTMSFKELGIWEVKSTQKEAYDYFYKLNKEIKSILEKHTNEPISNWEAEHAFWKFTGNPNKVEKAVAKQKEVGSTIKTEETELRITANIELSDYLIPKVSQLIAIGDSVEKSSAGKGHQYEALVSEVFKLLGFDVHELGQGRGRNPDAVIKYREDNTAFIVDAKAYTSGYSLGLDDRAIKEYINHYCPKLQKDGYKKIGFIIVSNSFKTSFGSFINEMTWDTEVKRFILLTSEALLYLLAYKTKDRLSLSTIINSLISFGNPVLAQDVIEEFDDV